MTEKVYIGCKIIKAVLMDECSFLEEFKGQDVANRETRSGYKVTYPDGYISWSPIDTFEISYREVIASERDLFQFQGKPFQYKGDPDMTLTA